MGCVHSPRFPQRGPFDGGRTPLYDGTYPLIKGILEYPHNGSRRGVGGILRKKPQIAHRAPPNPPEKIHPKFHFSITAPTGSSNGY